MLAEVIGIFAAGRGVGLLCFHEPDVFADFLRGNRFVQAIAHKQRFAKIIEAEIAACALHGVFTLTVALDNALHALGGDAVGVVHHLDKNKLAVSAVRFVHVQHRMGGGAGTGEGIKDNIGIFCDCLNHAFNQCNRFRIVERFGRFRKNVFKRLRSVNSEKCFFSPYRRNLSAYGLIFSK